MKHLYTVIISFFLSSACLANTCKAPINLAEQKIHAPKDLLYSVAIVESGRMNRQTKKIEPYPWAININGKDIFYPTKQAAIDGVKKFQQKGIKSIDVGCMQINLHHHKKAFKNLDDAFDPEKNVAYAAKFMEKLRKDFKSWSRAISYYHSRTPKHYIRYQKKVYHTWNEEKRKSYRDFYASQKRKNIAKQVQLRQTSLKKFPAYPKHKSTIKQTQKAFKI